MPPLAKHLEQEFGLSPRQAQALITRVCGRRLQHDRLVQAVLLLVVGVSGWALLRALTGGFQAVPIGMRFGLMALGPLWLCFLTWRQRRAQVVALPEILAEAAQEQMRSRQLHEDFAALQGAMRARRAQA